MAAPDYTAEAKVLLSMESPNVEDSLCQGQDAMEPIVVEQIPITPISVKNDEMLHLAYDAKLKDRDLLTQQFENMDLDKWSKFVSRIKERQVKVDANITAMGIFAMFPVAVPE